MNSTPEKLFPICFQIELMCSFPWLSYFPGSGIDKKKNDLA